LPIAIERCRSSPQRPQRADFSEWAKASSFISSSASSTDIPGIEAIRPLICSS
jgi:hypothetical protein